MMKKPAFWSGVEYQSVMWLMQRSSSGGGGPPPCSVAFDCAPGTARKRNWMASAFQDMP